MDDYAANEIVEALARAVGRSVMMGRKARARAADLLERDVANGHFSANPAHTPVVRAFIAMLRDDAANSVGG